MAESIIPNGQGRLQLNYVRAGFPATSNLYVHLMPYSGSYAMTNHDNATAFTVAQVWALLDGLFLPLLPTTAHMTSLYLWRYLDGAWYFVESLTDTSAGTGTEAPDPCTFLNIRLRDQNWIFGAVTVTEPSFAASVASKLHGETWGDLTTFISALCAGTDDGTDIGSIVCSKPGGLFRHNPNWTLKVSDRIRRMRGYI